MSILGNIFSKIFSRGDAAGKTPGGATSQGATPAPQAQSAPPASDPNVAPAAPLSQATPAREVDVEAVLNAMAQKNPQKLNWRTSIVDLMKLLDLDSSLTARKELAKELDYSGDMNDSAAMNIWLHKQVMKKLAENGGKVPAELRH